MSAGTTQPSGCATGSVRAILRYEALAVLLGSLFAFHSAHGRWLIFAVLFFAPDLSFAGYAISRSVGTVAYNTVHSYILPVSLLLWGYFHPAVLPYVLIWTAHIGFDRVLGYGLKYKTGFEHTHLGTMGKAKAL
jgi:hypothetical protein